MYQASLDVMYILYSSHLKANPAVGTSGDLLASAEVLLPEVMSKNADMVPRVTAASSQLMTKLANLPLFADSDIFVTTARNGLNLDKPNSIAWREAKGRLDTLTLIINITGVHSNFNSHNIMPIVEPLLKHGKPEVRDAAMLVAQALAVHEGVKVDSLMGLGSASLRSVVSPRHGEPSKSVPGATSPTTSPDKKKDSPSKVNSLVKEMPASKKKVKPVVEITDSTCLFCGAYDEKFSSVEATEEHYYKSCPMLMRCKYCTKVLEISTLVKHWSKDCLFKKKLRVCPNCQDFYPADDASTGFEELENISQHIRNAQCIAKPVKVALGACFCPLCREEMAESERGWTVHLGVCLVNRKRLKNAGTATATENKSVPPRRNFFKRLIGAAPETSIIKQDTVIINSRGPIVIPPIAKSPLNTGGMKSPPNTGIKSSLNTGGKKSALPVPRKSLLPVSSSSKSSPIKSPLNKSAR